MGTPQDHENYFFELPGYVNSMIEKRIFELSPIEKKLLLPKVLAWISPIFEKTCRGADAFIVFF